MNAELVSSAVCRLVLFGRRLFDPPCQVFGFWSERNDFTHDDAQIDCLR